MNQIFPGKALLEYAVSFVVDDPENVKISVLEGDKSVILELQVSEESVGKVIGKQGRMIKALRILLGVLASKLDKRILLEIL